ncbi:hypothetical protein B7P43_G14541 [Cryptotermes secundus]|uniref:Uncharacterized protein n=1 Tax=Cryptotermes secundus TaxID=105785 RepID=A0A2J7QGK5_9NEOP|nr:hypothetical protein B7P43_G14541 [Cryptotermes secundus]
MCLFKTEIDMMPSDTQKNVIHADKTAAGQHVQRFSAPTIDEMADNHYICTDNGTTKNIVYPQAL